MHVRTGQGEGEGIMAVCLFQSEILSPLHESVLKPHVPVSYNNLSSWGQVFMEGLIGMLVVLDPTAGAWQIDQSLWLWKIIRWSVIRYPIDTLYVSMKVSF